MPPCLMRLWVGLGPGVLDGVGRPPARSQAPLPGTGGRTGRYPAGSVVRSRREATLSQLGSLLGNLQEGLEKNKQTTHQKPRAKRAETCLHELAGLGRRDGERSKPRCTAALLPLRGASSPADAAVPSRTRSRPCPRVPGGSAKPNPQRVGLPKISEHAGEVSDP